MINTSTESFMVASSSRLAAGWNRPPDLTTARLDGSDPVSSPEDPAGRRNLGIRCGPQSF
jgi:hypothetical protein